MIKFNKTMVICDGCGVEAEAVHDSKNPFKNYIGDGIYMGQQVNNFTCPYDWSQFKFKHFCPKCSAKIEAFMDEIKNNN